MLPAFLGFAGASLTDDERAFFREAAPAGFILFGRNCGDRTQLRRLTDDLRDLTGRTELPILIDQEGGRVVRMKPPQWPSLPAGARFAALYRRAPISAIEAARVHAEAIAVMLAEVGVNVDCMPVLDVPRAGAHEVIGDRALGDEPMQVAALGRAMLDGLAAGGVCGVIKHMPGHGRASADSHGELPVVDATDDELAIDLAPFRALRNAPMAMTAHVLYPVWDAAHCASVSATVIGDIIRGRIGFDGLLMSDDLTMRALSGTTAERARAAIAAGCDVVLQGSGRLEESEQLAGALGRIGDPARVRLDRAMAQTIGRHSDRSFDDLAAKRDALLAFA